MQLAWTSTHIGEQQAALKAIACIAAHPTADADISVHSGLHWVRFSGARWLKKCSVDHRRPLDPPVLELFCSVPLPTAKALSEAGQGVG